jgi:hypothetical protein
MGAELSTPFPPQLASEIGKSLSIRDASRVSQVSRRGNYGSRAVLDARKQQFKDDIENRYYKDIANKYTDPNLFEMLFNMYKVEDMPFFIGVYCQTLPQNVMLEMYMEEAFKHDNETRKRMLTKIIDMGGIDPFLRQHAGQLHRYFDITEYMSEDDMLDEDDGLFLGGGLIYLLAEMCNDERTNMSTDSNDLPVSNRDLLDKVIPMLSPQTRMFLSFATGDPNIYTEAIITEIEGIPSGFLSILFSKYVGFLVYGRNIDIIKRVLLAFLSAVEDEHKEDFLTVSLSFLFSFIFTSPFDPNSVVGFWSRSVDLDKLFKMLQSQEIGARQVMRTNRHQIFGLLSPAPYVLANIYYNDMEALRKAAGRAVIPSIDLVNIISLLHKRDFTLDDIKEVRDEGKPFLDLVNVSLSFYAFYKGDDIHDIKLYLSDIRTVLQIDYFPTLIDLMQALSTLMRLSGYNILSSTQYNTEITLPDSGFENIFKMFTNESAGIEAVSEICSNIHQLNVTEASGVPVVYGNVLVKRACVCGDIQMLKYITSHKEYIPIDDETKASIVDSKHVPISFKTFVQELV